MQMVLPLTPTLLEEEAVPRSYETVSVSGRPSAEYYGNASGFACRTRTWRHVAQMW